MSDQEFQEKLLNQYTKEINETFQSCVKPDKSIDYATLSPKLWKLMKIADIEGIKESDFKDLFKSLYPDSSDHVQWDHAEESVA